MRAGRWSRALAPTVVMAATLATLATDATAATHAPPAVRLYVLDCGTLIFNHPEDYNLAREEVRHTNMSVACYLVVHPRGTLLFDTGLPDSVQGRPIDQAVLGGYRQAPSTEYFMLVRRPLLPQLTALGFPPRRIDYLVLSHYHDDHVGNANAFATATWLVQAPELEAMFAPAQVNATIPPNYLKLREARRVVLHGDHDVFGDGTVVVKSTPGHTPGHQSLFVKLAKTGNVVLSGDLYHYPEERTLHRMPTDEARRGTPASREALDAFLAQVNGTLWIGHDITAFGRQRKAPAFYE